MVTEDYFTLVGTQGNIEIMYHRNIETYMILLTNETYMILLTLIN